MAADGRIKLTVLGGFLGSGKTTWLRHQLHAGRFAEAFVIVNEAAQMPVDDILLGQSSRMAVLAGGCACCETQAELVTMLRELCDARSRVDSRSDRLQRIVLETSGLARPGPIVEAIRSDPMLVHHIVVSEIIVVVDALHALSQLRSEPLGRDQVEIADRLVVAKIDAADVETVASLVATLKSVNPGAAISGAVRGADANLPDATSAMPEPLPDLGAANAVEPVFPTKLVIDERIDWTAFSVWLSALLHARGDDVLRVKGVIRTPAGRLLLQSVRRIVQAPEMLPDDAGGEDNAIIVIGRGYRGVDLERSLRHFAGVGSRPKEKSFMLAEPS